MNVLDFFSLENKVAIVTGGYGYLGKAFVQSLNEAGQKLLWPVEMNKSLNWLFPLFPISISALWIFRTQRASKNALLM